MYQATYRRYLVLSICYIHACKDTSLQLWDAKQQVYYTPQNQDPETKNRSRGGEKNTHLPVRGYLGPKSKCWEQLVPVGRQ